MKSNDISPKDSENNTVIENKELSIWEALIPVIALVAMLRVEYLGSTHPCNRSCSNVILQCILCVW